MTIVEREREADVQVDERERRASVLEAAALEIDVRGWCQGSSEDDEGRVCMMGAIDHANNGARNWSHAMDIWDSEWHWTMAYVGEGCMMPLAEWNDVCPDRTAAEVCFVLRWRAQEIRDGR